MDWFKKTYVLWTVLVIETRKGNGQQWITRFSCSDFIVLNMYVLTCLEKNPNPFSLSNSFAKIRICWSVKGVRCAKWLPMT